MVSSFFAAIFALYILSFFKPYASDHRFKRGDPVPLFVNKLGPFHDESETYPYYDLPFCSPVGVEGKKETPGEVLDANRLVVAPYKIHFLIDREPEIVCTKRLGREAVAQFRNVILKDFVFHMYLDDIPILLHVGRFHWEDENDPTRPAFLLYKHREFEILYNEDRILDFAVHHDRDTLVNLTEDKETDIYFSYSVIWTKADVPFKKRLERDPQSSLLQHLWEIPTFRVINFFVYSALRIKLLLLAILKFRAVVMFADNQQQYHGWRHIRGDVFRYPRHKSLFAAAVGTGFQLVAFAFLAYITKIADMFHPDESGSLFLVICFIYSVSSLIAGCAAVSFHFIIEGTDWVKTSVLTGWLFSGPLYQTFSFLNFVALAHNSTALLPFREYHVLLLTAATYPCLIAGGWIAGMDNGLEFQAPRRASSVPRQIPRPPWYRRAPFQIAFAASLPFKAIYSCYNIDYILASVWGHQIHTVHNNLFDVLMTLFICTALSAVLFTCFQLLDEDHEWWWRSFFYGGSVSFFIFGYSCYFYYARSDISGFLQTYFFFSYMVCICYGLFLMLGAVGFTASFIFMKNLYRPVHQD